MSHTKNLTDHPTTPVINVLQDGDQLNRYSALYLRLSNPTKRNLVEFHKEQLGPQNYCWTGERKNWIWEFEQDEILLRVFVNNIQGISIEVSPNTDPEEALLRVERYVNRMRRTYDL